MNRPTFAIVILALLEHSCIAEIVHNNMELEHLHRLYKAAVDISMTCYGDPGNAIGIIGDTDGSILKAFRSKHTTPVVLINRLNYRIRHRDHNARLQKLKVFVIAVRSPKALNKLLFEASQSIWWNSNANFIIVDSRPNLRFQCLSADWYLHLTFEKSIFNAQFICHNRGTRSKEIEIYNSNPFINRAPKVWTLVWEYSYRSTDDSRTGFLFARLYREGGQSCESINFSKTRDVGGYPLRFITDHPDEYRRGRVFSQTFDDSSEAYENVIDEWKFNLHRLLIDNIVITMNVSEVLTNDTERGGIALVPCLLSSSFEITSHYEFGMIRRTTETPIFAVTQHTPHMTQLEKILTVIDEKSRIGMWLVYLITFMFFKFFLRQAVMPALLNLVRLTCGTGLPTLPQNLAPTIYLACLFMFVVTIQGIYTGNLSTLLTTTIPYPNVQMREDIPKRGYKLHINEDDYAKLTADPMLAGHVIEIPRADNCIEHVLRDPSAVCAMNYQEAIMAAAKWKLHVSRDPILRDYIINIDYKADLFKRKIAQVMMTSFEAGLQRSEIPLERIRLKFVDDDEVKKNTDRRVMTLDDLGFAFVILGVGLLCSFICFIGEIVIWKIRIKNAKGRDRVRSD